MKKGELLNTAIMLAVNGHHNQYDRGNNPYILHVLKVMHLLKSNDEELQCIALLHDWIEDTGGTYKELIEAGMTERITNGVRCLTKVPGESYSEYKEKVFSNIDAMLVKSADLRHNSDINRLKGVTEKDVARMVRYHNFFIEIQTRLEG